jgi:predicted DCC family thiol-disulfide oxidoreductase YuxK
MATTVQDSTTTRTKAVVLFDGACPFCRKSVGILQVLDWLNHLEFRNCRDTANLPESAVPLEPKRLIEEMHLVTPDRQSAYAGFAAFRWMSWRLPLLWPVAPFLYLPGMPWLGNKAYLWVAKNRFALVPCKDGVCELPKR